MSTYFFENQNSKSFYNMSWIAFAVSFTGMILGIVYLNADIAVKGFFTMAYLFSVTACFTLSKVVRDKYEIEKHTHRT